MTELLVDNEAKIDKPCEEKDECVSQACKIESAKDERSCEGKAVEATMAGSIEEQNFVNQGYSYCVAVRRNRRERLSQARKATDAIWWKVAGSNEEQSLSVKDIAVAVRRNRDERTSQARKAKVVLNPTW